MILIEDKFWTLVVDPENGGSVRMLRWNDFDILRSAPDGTADPFSMASFPLAPFSNRIGHNGFDFEGRFYPLDANIDGIALPIHGFAWQREWAVSEQRPNGIMMVMDDFDSPWPQPYRVEQDIALAGNGVRFSLKLANLGDGDMPGGIGFHPYFPRGNSRCRIDPGRMWVQDMNGMPNQLTTEHPFAKGIHPMREVRVDHSFSEWDGWASIIDPDRKVEICLTASDSLRELVIYSPEDDFFCLEPVGHVTNAVHGDSPAKRKGWQILAPGETISGWFDLVVREIT